MVFDLCASYLSNRSQIFSANGMLSSWQTCGVLQGNLLDTLLVLIYILILMIFPIELEEAIVS